MVEVASVKRESGDSYVARRNPSALHERPPNPKKPATGEIEPRPFVRFPANFSLDFANWAIGNFASFDESILDPFCGSATSLLSAQARGIRGRGIELNPAWVVYGKGRLVSNSSNLENEVDKMLRRATPRGEGISTEWLQDLFTQVLADAGRDLSGSKALFASAVLCCARKAACPKYGMNHSWPRMDPDHKITITKRALLSSLNGMIVHSRWVRENYPCLAEPAIEAGDARRIRRDIGASLIITSPPYLSRLDYIRSSRPELLFLEQIGALRNAEGLRGKQIGSVVLSGRNSIESRDALPEACRHLVDEVEDHPSKGSESYYAKHIADYLISMQCVWKSISSIAPKPSRLVMVVQNSWYKDILIDTSSLLTELLVEQGWKSVSEWGFDVPSSLSFLNPNSRQWRGSGKMRENVIVFERGKNAS